MNLYKNYVKISNLFFLVFFATALTLRAFEYEAVSEIKYGLGFLILLPLIRIFVFFDRYRREKNTIMLGVCITLGIILVLGFQLGIKS